MTPSETHNDGTESTREFSCSWSREEIFEGVLPEVIRFFQSRGYSEPIQLGMSRSEIMVGETSEEMVGERGGTFCLLCVKCDGQEHYVYCPYHPSGEMLQVDFDKMDFLEPDMISELRGQGILPL